MRRVLPLALLLALVVAAPAAAQSSTALERALGGTRALSGLDTFSYRASGEAFVLNEGFNPGAAPRRADTFTVSVLHRIRGPEAVRLDYVRNNEGVAPRNVKEVIAGRRGAITGQYENFGPPITD